MRTERYLDYGIISVLRRTSRQIASHGDYNRKQNTNFQIKRKIVHKFGHPQVDLFASRANTKCHRYVMPERSRLHSHRRFHIKMETLVFLRIPSFFGYFKSIKKNREGRVKRYSGRAIVGSPAVISTVFESIRDLIFQSDINLIRSSHREAHPLWHRLTLIAGKLSGEPLSGEKFHWNQ